MKPLSRTAKKLLIVDDLEGVREVYTELFNPYFEIKAAERGEEALELFHSFQPDVVYLDIHLEGTSASLQGPALLRLMKMKRPGVLICIISSDSSREDELIQAGADAFFDKDPSRGQLFDFLIARGLLEVVQDLTRNGPCS